jgi:hypothetical protein
MRSRVDGGTPQKPTGCNPWASPSANGSVINTGLNRCGVGKDCHPERSEGSPLRARTRFFAARSSDRAPRPTRLAPRSGRTQKTALRSWHDLRRASRCYDAPRSTPRFALIWRVPRFRGRNRARDVRTEGLSATRAAKLSILGNGTRFEAPGRPCARRSATGRHCNAKRIGCGR